MRTTATIYQPIAPAAVTENNAQFVSTDDSELNYKNAVGGTEVVTDNIKQKQNGSGGILNSGTPVSLLANGKIIAADSDGVNTQDFIGVLLETVDDDNLGKVKLVGSNVKGVLASLGFNPGEEIFMSESGGYTNDAGVAAFTGNDDSIIRMGIADSAAGIGAAPAVDLIMMTEIISRP